MRSPTRIRTAPPTTAAEGDPAERQHERRDPDEQDRRGDGHGQEREADPDGERVDARGDGDDQQLPEARRAGAAGSSSSPLPARAPWIILPPTAASSPNPSQWSRPR